VEPVAIPSYDGVPADSCKIASRPLKGKSSKLEADHFPRKVAKGTLRMKGLRTLAKRGKEGAPVVSAKFNSWLENRRCRGPLNVDHTGTTGERKRGKKPRSQGADGRWSKEKQRSYKTW